MYNEELEFVRQAEQEGRCLVIRPEKAIPIGHISHDADEMKRVYDMGRHTANRYLADIRRFYRLS